MFGKRTLWAFMVFLAVSWVSADKSWWVDDNCILYFGKEGFDKIMAEVIDTSNLAVNRMGRPKAEEPQAYDEFEAIFKFAYDTSDPLDVDRVKYFKDREFGPDHIGTFAKLPLEGDEGRKKAMVRIHCDNDDRYQLVPDGSEQVARVVGKNSERPAQNQEWEDTINHMRILGPPLCKHNSVRTDNELITMFTSHGFDLNSPGEAAPRSSISICDFYLDRARYHLIEQAPKKKLWGITTGLHPIDAFKVTSMVLYHEFHHIELYQRTDHGAKWEGVYGLDKSRAYDNGDSFAYFGICMWVLERQYKLDKDMIKYGTWAKDRSIVKRMPRNSNKRAATIISCVGKDRDASKTGLQCREFQA